MSSGRLSAVALALAIALAGCGAGASDRTPRIANLPLVPGASVVTQAQRCDQGANSYCALEFVVVDQRYKSSEDLVRSERLLLKHSGWSGANADIGPERAADSPGHKLRVTFATAFGDLTGTALGWIKRPQSIKLALAHTMIARQAAMSMMLEVGNG